MDGFHDNKWFVYINDHHEGPFSMAQLQSKLQTGEVNRTQYVWAEGMPDWQLMTTVRDLDPILTLTAAPIFAPPAVATYEHEPSLDMSFDEQAPIEEPVLRPAREPGSIRVEVAAPAARPAPVVEPAPVTPILQPREEPVALQPAPIAPIAPVAPAAQPVQPAAPIAEPVLQQPVIQQVSAPVLEAPQPIALEPVVAARQTPQVEVPPALDELRDERFDSEPSLDSMNQPSKNEGTPQMMFGSVSSDRHRSGGFLKIFLFLAILGAVAYGYVSGVMDPVLKNPQVVSAAVFVRDVTSPAMTRVAQWVPQLQRWISPIPYLSGVDKAELAELRANAQRSNPPRLVLAVDRTDPSSPSFHVSSALPNGTKLDLVLIGTPETLLSQTSLELKATTEIVNRLATFEGLRQLDGRPIAQGEYRVFVMESDSGSQLPEVEAALNELPDSRESIPSDAAISGKRKLFLQKTYFLAGEKDETYSKRVKDFHDRLRTRSADELKELAGIVQTLTLQLTSTIEEHAKISSGKISKSAEKNWNEFHDKWTGQQTQLDTSFAGWAESLAQKEFYHWGLYQMVKQLSERVSQLHVQQHSGVLIRPTDEKEFQAQLNERQKAAREALTELDRKLTESRKLNEGVEGMPKRLKFEEESAPVAVDAAAPEAAPAEVPAVQPEASEQPSTQPASASSGKAR
jgi:hypothetical protein